MESDEPGIRFKAKKRTKTLRQRDRDPVPDATTTTTSSIIAAATDAPASDHDNNSNEEAIDGAFASSSVQAALKLRQSRTKHRFRGGVGFGRNEPAAHAGSNDDDTSLVPRDAATTVAQGLPDRFMHHTGFIADADDRHMTAYVESRLSSRRGASAEEQQQQQQQHNLAVDDGSDKRPVDMRRRTNAPGTMQTGTSTTSWTRLVEVKVPADVGSNNNNNNNNSKKRSLDAADTTKQNPPRRRRNRRGSDDMKRDAMVEAFLHENKLDVYDVSDASAAANDASLAENFRKQYMQEVAARRQRRRPALNQPRHSQKQLAHQQAVAAGEVLKGPKLGGSRNARAAVRNALLQEQELRKKGK